MKKLISVTLILMLVFALGCTAFADSGVPITKNPTDEVRSAGGTAWFVSGAYNYNSAEWKFMDPNGTFMNAQEFRNRFPYATVTGDDSNLALWISLMIMSAAAGMVVFTKRKKSVQENFK